MPKILIPFSGLSKSTTRKYMPLPLFVCFEFKENKVRLLIFA